MAPQPDRRDSVARILLILASMVIVIAGMRTASSFILPFLFAAFLAILCLPVMNWLQSRGLPTSLSIAITVIAALTGVGGVVGLIGGSISSFTAAIPRYKARLDGMTTRFVDWLQERGVDVSDQTGFDLIDPAAALDLAQSTMAAVLTVLSNFLLVLLTIVFILSEAAGFPGKLDAAFGSRRSLGRFDKIKSEVQRYLGIKTLVSLTTGIVVGAALAIIGVDFALLWGTLAFLLNYIPTLGSFIAAIPAVMLALIQLGPGSAVATAIVFTAVNVVLGNFVEPYLMGRRFGLSTLVVFISLLFWGWVWGPLGMLLSVPLTMIIKIMLENSEQLRWVGILLGPAERPKARAAETADSATGAAPQRSA